MFFGFKHGRKAVVEDPDTLGYRLVTDDLLGVMTAAEWLAIEIDALATAPPPSEPVAPQTR